MTEDVKTYTYQSIEYDEVRLCRFVKQTDHICAKLKIFSTKTLPPYQTLSYVWSEDEKDCNPTKTWEIKVDECLLPVLDTLKPFFQALDERECLLDGTWWWIDSVCIDQGNNEERNQQVQLMRQLYSDCRACVVWLGKATNDDVKVVDFIHHLDRLWEDGSGSQNLQSKLRQSKYTESWHSLMQFLSRRWWSRVWTLQEFICPPKITFWYGTRAVNRTAVCRAILLTDECAPSKFISTSSYRQAWNRRRIWLRHINLSEVPPRYAGLSLPALAAYSCTNQATNDLDRLYGLHGLVTIDRELLQVEYSQTVDESYLQFAKSFINKHASLDLCIYASIFGPMEISILPTWVPDWRRSTGRGRKVMPLMVSQSGNPNLGNLRPIWSISDGEELVCYQASGDRKCVVTIEGAILVACGVALDKVTDPNTIGDETDTPSSMVAARMPTDPKEVLLSVCRCLALDRQDRYLRLPIPENDFFNDFMKLCKNCITSPSTADGKFLHWFNTVRLLQLNGQTLEALLKQYLHGLADIPVVNSPKQKYDDLHSFYVRFRDTIKGMSLRMIVTKDGRLAMVPEHANPDDIVCVLYGCSVPVLLRKVDSEDAYTLVGECYVDQFMYGKALELGFDEKDFRIC